MKILGSFRNFLDKKVEPYFVSGGKWEKFYPIYEMFDTISFTPGKITKGRCHVRDGLDQKRMMITVVIALLFPLAFGVYNVGYQANSVIESISYRSEDWRILLMSMMNLKHDPNQFLSNLILGLFYFLPVFVVTLATGGFWEVLFAVVRKHDVTEGFLVTAFLIPLVLPPTIPLWQVAVGTSFGIVIGKEIFGGVGFNLLNPALTARAFLFFAYPAEISGDAVWVAVDGVSRATALSLGAVSGIEGILSSGYTLLDAFIGFIPGSMGETSVLACLIGAGYLIFTGVGSWRIMFSVLLGMLMTTFFFNLVAGSVGNPMFTLPPWWHFSLGGFAFGMIYMATDPVSAAMTQKGKWIYGFLIGVLASLIRVVNPAYPEGMMLAILLMNVFAPLLDHFVIKQNIKSRLAGYGRLDQQEGDPSIKNLSLTKKAGEKD